MKHFNYLAATAFVAAMALPGYAAAQNAMATADVNMRAGPGTRYPVVSTVPEDRRVTLHGCEQNFDWCDVSWRGERGWVFADYLDVSWRDRRSSVSDVGPRIDLPIVGFAMGDYWDQNYRDRSWYEERQRWEVVGDAHMADPRVTPDEPRADMTTWQDRRRDGVRGERDWGDEADATMVDRTTGSVGPRTGAPTWQDRRDASRQHGERRWGGETSRGAFQ